MPYTPPSGLDIYFDFTEIQWAILAFNFSILYTPPSSTSLNFDFPFSLFPLDFDFAPEVAPPISKELLLSLGLRFHGQVYKYWICYVIGGKQYIRRYGKHGSVNPTWTEPWQIKFAAGVKSWQNLNDLDKLYWHRIGARKLKPITSLNAYLSAWLSDKVN